MLKPTTNLVVNMSQEQHQGPDQRHKGDVTEGSQSYFRELMFKGTGVQCSWDTFVIMGISECGPRINEHSWSDHGRT